MTNRPKHRPPDLLGVPPLRTPWGVPPAMAGIKAEPIPEGLAELLSLLEAPEDGGPLRRLLPARDGAGYESSQPLTPGEWAALGAVTAGQVRTMFDKWAGLLRVAHQLVNLAHASEAARRSATAELAEDAS